MVLVYTENWDGKFKKASFEVVSYGAALAEMLNTEVVAVSLGPVEEDELKKLANYGANKIIAVNDEKLTLLDNKVYSEVLAQVIEKTGADIFVFSNNNTGRGIAPRIAARFKAGIVTAVDNLPVSVDPFTLKKKVFTGKGFADVVIKSEKKVITLFPNSFGVHEKPTDAVIETMDVNVPESTVKLLERKKAEGKILLTEAEIVVSGGRGMKGPENWGPLEEFAELLGAATACSRPVADEGWRPHEEHVGQTGKVIAPTVYFALGISGAVQHIGGVSGAKYIVAVNIDKDAPIFEVADYGIVGDVHKILPEMIEAVKKIKQQG